MSVLELMGEIYLWGVAGSATATLVIVIVETVLVRARGRERITMSAAWFRREMIEALLWPLLVAVGLYVVSRRVARSFRGVVSNDDVDL